MSDETGNGQPTERKNWVNNYLLFATIVICLIFSWPFGFGLIHFVHGYWLGFPSTISFIFYFAAPLLVIICFFLLVSRILWESSLLNVKAEIIMVILCLALGCAAVWFPNNVDPHLAGVAFRGKVSINQEEVQAWMKNQSKPEAYASSRITNEMLPPTLRKFRPNYPDFGWDMEEDSLYLRLYWISDWGTDSGFFFWDSDKPYPHSTEGSTTPVIEIAPGFWAF